MSTKMETIPEMRARHRRELEALIETMAARRITQTEAAKILGVSLTCLNNIICRNDIFWPVIRHGRKAKERSDE